MSIRPSRGTSLSKLQQTATYHVLTALGKNEKKTWTGSCSKVSLMKQATTDQEVLASTYLENLSSIQESLRLLDTLKNQIKDIRYCLPRMEHCLISLRKNWINLESIESSGVTGKTTSTRHLKGCLRSVDWCDCSEKRLQKKRLKNGRSTQG